MKHEYRAVNGQQYIVCQGCQRAVGKQAVAPSDWAAWEHPGVEIVVTGIKTTISPRTALCGPCFIEAYMQRYPGKSRPTLEDRRLNG